MTEIIKEELLQALRAAFHGKEAVTDAVYTAESLQGGDVGAVYRVSGEAVTGKEKKPFTLILKEQKKWERSGDPDCWRREYDLYTQGVGKAAEPFIYIPESFHTVLSGDRTRIWMEDINGRSGDGLLSEETLSLIARRTGGFQARYARSGGMGFSCLRHCPALIPSFRMWSGMVKEGLAAPVAGFPEAIRRTLAEYAENAETVFGKPFGLPVTMCHGDAWINNLFLRGDEVYMIDWDCAGEGYMGEDIVDLLLDETFVDGPLPSERLPLYRQRLFGAYKEGAEAEGVTLNLTDGVIRELFIYSWGYRIFAYYMHVRDKDPAAAAKLTEILGIMLG